jgi:hypothetical protein
MEIMIAAQSPAVHDIYGHACLSMQYEYLRAFTYRQVLTIK